MIAEEIKVSKLERECKGFQAINTINHSIKKDGVVVFTYNLGQIHACCGTALLSNGSLQVSNNGITDDIKKFIFNEIISYCKSNNLRNILFTDIEDEGALNFIIGDKFKLLDKYRNVNTNNIVEIKGYNIDPDLFGYPSDYDEEGYDDYEDDDDY